MDFLDELKTAAVLKMFRDEQDRLGRVALEVCEHTGARGCGESRMGAGEPGHLMNRVHCHEARMDATDHSPLLDQ